jgi:hypothetical protein
MNRNVTMDCTYAKEEFRNHYYGKFQKGLC